MSPPPSPLTSSQYTIYFLLPFPPPPPCPSLSPKAIPRLWREIDGVQIALFYLFIWWGNIHPNSIIMLFIGSGLRATYSTIEMKHCEITENSVRGSGAGLNLVSSSCSLRDTTISGNSATELGGGLYLDNSDYLISNCSVSFFYIFILLFVVVSYFFYHSVSSLPSYLSVFFYKERSLKILHFKEVASILQIRKAGFRTLDIRIMYQKLKVFLFYFLNYE